MDAPAEGGAVESMTANIRLMKKMHEDKVRSLMKSIHILKDQLTLAKATSKEHRRSALIQQLRDAVKDQESTVDLLRQTLVDRGMSTRQIDEIILTHSTKGPKRFRPKTREELQKDVAALTKRNALLEKKLKQKTAPLPPAVPETAVWEDTATVPVQKGAADEADGEQQRRASAPACLTIDQPTGDALSPSSVAGTEAGANLLRPSELKGQVDNMEEELKKLKTEVASAERLIAEQRRDLARLTTAEKEALDALARAEAVKHKYKSVKQELQDERQRRMREEEVAAGLRAQLKASEEEGRNKGEVAEIELAALRDEFNQRMADLRESYSREQRAREEAEQVRQAAATEGMALRHSLREEVQRREAVDRDKKALELRAKTLEAELSAAGKRLEGLQGQLPEQDKLKLKLRAANEHSKDLDGRLRSALAKLEVEKENRARAETSLEQQTQLFEALQGEAEHMRKEFNDALREWQVCKERLRAAHEAYKQSQAKERELQGRIERQLVDKAEVEVKLRDSLEHVQHLKDEGESAREELQTSFDEAQLEGARLKIRVDDLQEQLARAGGRVKELEEQANTEAKRAREVELRLSGKERELEELKRQLSEEEDLTGQLSEERARVENLERETEALKTTRASLQRDVHRQGLAFEREKASLLRDKLNLEQSLEASQKRVEELAKKLEDMERRREEEKIAEWEEEDEEDDEEASPQPSTPTRPANQEPEVGEEGRHAQSAEGGSQGARDGGGDGEAGDTHAPEARRDEPRSEADGGDGSGDAESEARDQAENPGLVEEMRPLPGSPSTRTSRDQAENPGLVEEDRARTRPGFRRTASSDEEEDEILQVAKMMDQEEKRGEHSPLRRGGSARVFGANLNVTPPIEQPRTRIGQDAGDAAS